MAGDTNADERKDNKRCRGTTPLNLDGLYCDPGSGVRPLESFESLWTAIKSHAIDPTYREPSLGVKEVAAPKERMIAAHRASGG